MIADCVVCLEEKETFQAPCGHGYCEEDLAKLIETAMETEATFPPACCNTPIPLKLVRGLFPREFTSRLDKKISEYATPIADRTYCFSCGHFCQSKEILSNRATCRRCSRETCTACKQQYHRGSCPQDRRPAHTSTSSGTGMEDVPPMQDVGGA